MPQLTSLQQELAEEERALRAEQEWFLATQVKPGLENIQKALTACQDAARLQDDAKGALTLAISSTNNDTLKGFVTLAGSFIVKGDLTVKLPKLPVVKATIHSNITSNVSAPVASTLLATAAAAPSSSNAGSSTVASSNSSVTGVPSTMDNAEVAVVESCSRSAETDGSSADGSHEDRQKPLQDAQQEPSLSTQQAALGNTQIAHQPLNTYRPPGHLTQPYFLEQLKDVQNHTAEAIHKLEDYWQHVVRLGEQKDKTREKASSSQDRDPAISSLEIAESIGTLKTLLQLMQRHLRAGIQAMAQPGKEKLYPFKVCDPKIFSPALSEDFVVEFYIRDSQLVCAAYALQLTGGNHTSSAGGGGGGALVSYLQQALPGTSTPSMAPASPTPAATPSVRQSAEGFIPHSSPQPPPTVYGGTGTGVSGAHLSALSAASPHVGSGGGSKSGQVTPHATSPSVLQHHHTSATQPSHQRQLSSGPIQQLPQAGAKSSSSSFPWSPSRTVSVTDVHPHASAAPPSNESVVLPSSNKIGQTSKGGIK
ncbi:hypothetical protein BGZ68_007774 [Mortierella alpina]|nr:hypothetical protein BGZ68_007774 [Mortierella alpina]